MISLLDYKVDIFLRTARLLNISQAARELNISQPAVTTAVQKLEKEFEVKLFFRYPQGLELTPTGILLQSRLQEIKDRCVQLENDMMQLRQELHGHLKLGASPTVSDYILPKLMGIFSDRFPRINYSLNTGNNAEVIRQLQEGKIELAFLAGNLPEQRSFSHKVLDDELVLIISPNHPWASQASINKEELLEQPLILRERGSGSRKETEEALVEIGLNPEQLKVIADFQSLEGIKNAVASGLGAALISRWAVTRELEQQSLLQVKIRDAVLRRDIFVVSLYEERLTEAAKRFLGFCKELQPETASLLF